MQKIRKSFFTRALLVVTGALASNLLVACAGTTSAAATSAPYPVAQPAEGQQVATFAGGCFWSMEAMFKQLKGVAKVEPGYAGGDLKNPSYEQVCSGQTGHAESINIIYDPKVVSYRDLLEVLMTVHDPTTLNQQGADHGTQYRSAVFFRSADQERETRDFIKKITAARQWTNPIVTQVAPYTKFYRAEDYHLNYYNLHPQQPYNQAVVAPKIVKFRARFKSKLKS